MRFLTAIIFALVFIFLAVVPIWASETQSVTGVVYETQAGQNQQLDQAVQSQSEPKVQQPGPADQQTNQQPSQNQPGSNSLAEPQPGQNQQVQTQSEPGQSQPGNNTQAGQQGPGQQQTDQPTQQPGGQQTGQQVDQQVNLQPGQNQQPDINQGQLSQVNQQNDQQSGQADRQTNQHVAGSSSGQQSVNESVYSGGQQDQPVNQQPSQQSVTGAAYSSGNQQQQTQQPVQPRPEVPAQAVVRAESPPPFTFRGKGTVQAAVYADVPVEMVLSAVENIPETVVIEIYYAGQKVAEVREGRIVYAVPFTISGNQQVEIRLSGRGKLQDAKLRFTDTPLAGQSGQTPEHAIQQPAQPGPPEPVTQPQPAQPGPEQSQGSDQPNQLSGGQEQTGQGQAGQSNQGQPGQDKQPDSQSVTEAVYGPA